ncbi:hypothetical protein BDR05DRAFT_928203 [Suillus weaverae]|nr:hypothetical protein BDR05DRAFT_928203 [Suillus weaverae]
MVTAPGIPPHRLDFKINSIWTILRNLSIEKDLIRHARVQITALYHRFVGVQLLNNLENHCIPCITFSFNPYRSSWTVNRKQFPLRLAYATTFNGCQGTSSCRNEVSCSRRRLIPQKRGLLPLSYFLTPRLEIIMNNKKKHSSNWFRSSDLRVMSPARFHCVMLLTINSQILTCLLSFGKN